MTVPVRARCLCGATRLAATAETDSFVACHCSLCRRWCAGPFLGVHCGAVTVEAGAELGVYQSSGWAERGFCRACGTPLFYRLQGQPVSVLSLEALETPDAFAFGEEIFIDEKSPLYDFAGTRPRRTGAEVIAAFEASQTGDQGRSA